MYGPLAAHPIRQSIAKFRVDHPAALRLGPWLVVAAVVAYVTVSLWWAEAFGLRVPVLLLAVLGGLAAGVAACRRLGVGGVPSIGPVEALVATALVAMVLNDLWQLGSDGLRDLAIYLRAGWLFDYQGQVYLDAPMTVLPKDMSLLPFLYPPFTLPFFGWLARLPYGVVAPAWVGLSLLAVVASLRLFGLSWRWSIAFLVWPPIAEGLYVGNVAVPALFLFAVGPWVAAALPFTAAFKLQSAIPTLWLAGERRWRALAVAGCVGLGLIVLTLPAVGPERWREWFEGLVYFSESAPGIPGLSGLALPVLIGPGAFAVVAVATVLLAVRRRGRQGLARLGIATIVASPSLYSHGFLVGLPGFLYLRTFWFWVAMGLTSTVAGLGWWGAIGLAVGAWFVPALARSAASDRTLHPLGVAAEPWPAAPAVPDFVPQSAGSPVGAEAGAGG